MFLVQLLKDENGFKLVNGVYIPGDSFRKVFFSAVLFVPSDSRGISDQISNFVGRYSPVYGAINSFCLGSRVKEDSKLTYDMTFFRCVLPNLPEQKVEDYQFPKELFRK